MIAFESFARVLKNRRGSTLPFVAMGLVMFLGMIALAVDLGMLFTARSEAQRAADAGAHAGAGALLFGPADAAGARAQARLFAEDNPVRWGVTQVLDEDIDVLLDERMVRVRVHQSEARGNPVRTVFARALGIRTVDIGAVAAAQVWPADRVNCVLPLVMPDRWSMTPFTPFEWPGPGDTFQPEEGHFYRSWSPDPNAGATTGYGTPDRGWRIQITMASPANAPQPGFSYAIRLPGARGGADFRAAIRGCWDPETSYHQGMEVIKEPGNMIGPTRQGFQDLINSDPDAIWNESLNCVTDRGGSECRHSSRIRPMLMFNPEDWPDIDQGAKPVTIHNFVGIFVESIEGQGDVFARFIAFTGVHPAAEWAFNSPLPQIIRIVE